MICTELVQGSRYIDRERDNIPLVFLFLSVLWPLFLFLLAKETFLFEILGFANFRPFCGEKMTKEKVYVLACTVYSV